MVLSWSKPENNGGAEINCYHLEKRDKDGVRWTKCNRQPLTDLHFKVTGLLDGHFYEYRVSAENEAGVGDLSELSLFYRACGSLRLFVTIRGRPEPEVKWAKLDGELTERVMIESTSSYTMLVIDNVNRFDSGKYTLNLENNTGEKSALINVRVLDTPSAPQAFAVKDIKKDSVNLVWETPLTDGGSKITNYIVEKRESTRKAYTAVTTNCLSNSFKIDELPEGCIFYFRVCAVNEYGIGLMAETKNPIKVSEVPMPPRNVRVTDLTKNSVSLAWEKPAHDGGSKVMCYNVEVQGKDDKGTQKWNTSCTVKILETTIANLVAGDAYSFRVIAINEKGKSVPKELGLPVTTKDIAIEPSIEVLFNTYSVKAGGDLTVEIPVRGRPKPVIAWKHHGLPLKQTSSLTILNTKTSSKIIIKEAGREHVGKYEITAANPGGMKVAEIGIIVLDKPGPPTAIKPTAVTSDSISLSWAPPEYDGGCCINNYIVEKRDTNATDWQMVSANVATTAIKASRLTKGAEYQFRIYAVNRYGKSQHTDSRGITAQYNFKLPGPPSTPKVVHATKIYMLVTWNEPVNDGGSTVLGYHLERKERTSIIWNKMNRGLIKDTEYKVTGIEEGMGYEYRVYAENIAGIGKCSKACEAVSARDPCDPPGEPTVTGITRTSVSLAWTKPEYDGGAKVTGYIIERRDLPEGRWMRCNFTNVVETYYDVTGLTKDQQYDFRVIAKNAAGCFSDPSYSTGSITVKDDVDPPRIMMDVKYRAAVVVKAGDVLKINKHQVHLKMLQLDG
uniref:Titin n=1 Tax=Salmo trutta TaxID=8032 RepID=A0A674F349_SALTR